MVRRLKDNGPWVRRLEGRGVIASARGLGLRVSFHAYNNDEDVDAILEALDAEQALVCRRSSHAVR